MRMKRKKKMEKTVNTLEFLELGFLFRSIDFQKVKICVVQISGLVVFMIEIASQKSPLIRIEC